MNVRNGEENDSMTVTTTDIERDNEVINKEIQEMSDGACGSICLVQSALLNNDAIKLANKTIVLQKGIWAIGQTKLESAIQINKKYAESTRLLAAARSQDAQAIEFYQSFS